jgi:radical SAM protein with 4Fe4S-binding SPASM domain
LEKVEKENYLVTERYVTETILPYFSLWGAAKEKRIPFSFDLEVTARCNNNCRHCYINLPPGSREAKNKELTFDEWCDIADQAVDLGALWCLITGGEPLIREDFFDLYHALKRKGLLISVFTNACLITDDHISLFKKYPPRDIEVTVYGATKGTYEKVTRRPGSFTAFRRGLDLLIGNGVKVRLKAITIRSNVHEMSEIARLCRSYTKDYFRFDPLLHLRFDGDNKRNAEIISERLSPDEIVAIEQVDKDRAEALIKGCKDLIVPEFEHQDCDHLFHCMAGYGSFNISYDGYFNLCSSLRHPDCRYDLRKGSLADAWTNFVPKVLDMRSADREFLERCRRCPIVNLCIWCPAHAYLESGRLDAWNNYFCDVAHARADAIRKRGLQSR